MRTLRSVLLSSAVLAAVTASAQAPDPRWTVIPNRDALDSRVATPGSPALNKALHDASQYVLRWRLPESADEWRLRRPEVERAFRKSIGLESLPERTPLNARTAATHDMGDYVIQNVIFESRPGFPVTANLYRPKAAARGKRAAVLCPIGHYLRHGKATAEVQARCIKLAKMGFVVLVYDAIAHGERVVAGNLHHQAGYALLPLGQTIAGWMVWDSMRAIDYLLTLDEVDPKRIGVTGNSGGGLNTLYTAALDPRVRCAAIAGFTFQFNTWIRYAGPHCTCTHLPGLYRAMEWFEIAGLIAPNAVLMLQGSEDNIFPVRAARFAGHAVESLYALLGIGARARLDVIAGQPHAYSRPFREPMYGWMAYHLRGEGSGGAIPEGDVQPLPEEDPRLRCDPDGSIIERAPTVISLARKMAEDAIARLKPDPRAVKAMIDGLTAPPPDGPDSLAASGYGKTETPNGVLEKVYFVSEIGQPVPGLLWLPRSLPARTVIFVNDRGKSASAESGLPEALQKAGYAVLAIDLRGRGETLGHPTPHRDNNFQFIQNSTLFGEPPAGRRAFDLRRAIDFVAGRKGLTADGLAVIGFGDDGLPALLAAASDTRIQRVAVAGFFSSFLSQIAGIPDQPRDTLLKVFNSSAIDRGRTNTGRYDFDLGSVLPSVLKTADLAGIVALVAPRKVLYCDTRDAGDAALAARFRRAAGGAWIRFEPDRKLDEALLLEWLGQR